MKRRNAIIWKDFYNTNNFCQHITLEDGEKMSRFVRFEKYNDKEAIFWVCSECNKKENFTLNLSELKIDDKGKIISKIVL